MSNPYDAWGPARRLSQVWPMAWTLRSKRLRPNLVASTVGARSGVLSRAIVHRTIGDREVIVETGEAAEFATMTPHGFAAIGETAELIMIFDREGQRAHVYREGSGVRRNSRAVVAAATCGG